MPQTTAPIRWVGLDLHKEYLLATGVNAEKQQVFGPARVQIGQVETWAKKSLTDQDAVIIEMTTNTWKVHDLLFPLVHSVTVVHPPHVALIVKARVMNDKKAALALAQLHAAGLLPGIWVPDQSVRDLRAIVEQRRKQVNLVITVKNRLHSVLHRHDVLPPPGMDLFAEDVRNWWLLLPVSTAEKIRIQSDLDTLFFAQDQKRLIESFLELAAVQDDRVPLLIQLPGIALIGAVTILAAIGEINRFPSARQLVGYAGLGTAVHESGMTHRTGRITKSGRRDLRFTMVEAAHHAADKHPHWKAELKRLEPRLGRNKAIVAIARKLLVSVWHVLTEGCVDRYADPERVGTGSSAMPTASASRTCQTAGVPKFSRAANWPGWASARTWPRLPTAPSGPYCRARAWYRPSRRQQQERRKRSAELARISQRRHPVISALSSIQRNRRYDAPQVRCILPSPAALAVPHSDPRGG